MAQAHQGCALNACMSQLQDQSNSWFNKALLIIVPFMVGWFALNLPAGLGLYYFSNTMITSGIQIWLRKLGGTHCLHRRSSALTLLSSFTTGPALAPHVWLILVAAALLDGNTHQAGASAFEWQQEIGLNQARRSGEVADMQALMAFAVAEAEAAAALGDGSAEAVQQMLPMPQVCKG